MKLLVVGSDKIFAIENFYVKYLRASGLEVTHFSVQTLFYDFYEKSILNRMTFRVGLSSIYESINLKLKSIVENQKPDIIWVFKGMEIFPETLRWARERKIVLVNYNPDNPYIFTGRGSGNSNIRNSLAFYDLHFTYNLDVMRRMTNDVSGKTAYLPFGFDVDQALVDSCSKQSEIKELCFLGNPDKERTKFILALLKKGIDISVYGNNWKAFLKNNKVNIFQPVYGDEQWKVLRKFRIQLNLMRPHNMDSHNMRTFEVPGIGGIMLAPNTTEHRMFFDDNLEAFFFSNVEMAVDKISWLLALPLDQAERIRIAARQRSLKSGYTYEARVKQVIAEFSKI